VGGIEDVSFVDGRHGWLVSFNCADITGHLYRTTDGGRSWQSLGTPTVHSCGGGPSFVSFVDARHGWLEALDPNGPGGRLLRTTDGGNTWKLVDGSESLPCLEPVALTTPNDGWMARSSLYNTPFCTAHALTTHDGGRSWRQAAVPVPRTPPASEFDLPRFFGRRGVVAETMASRPSPTTRKQTARAVAFAATTDAGTTWSLRSIRSIGPCQLKLDGPYFSVAIWPSSIASPSTWWVIGGREHANVQITTDAGKHWSTVVAQGLPPGCSTADVSAASSRTALVLVRVPFGPFGPTILYMTHDGGRTWRKVAFP